MHVFKTLINLRKESVKKDMKNLNIGREKGEKQSEMKNSQLYIYAII